MENQYRIYGKEKGKGGFKPMNVNEGTFVGSLIFASLLPKEHAEKQVDFMNKGNPGFVFEARKV